MSNHPYISLLLIGNKSAKVQQISNTLRTKIEPIGSRVYYNEVDESEIAQIELKSLPAVYINGHKVLYCKKNQGHEAFATEVMKHIV